MSRAYREGLLARAFEAEGGLAHPRDEVWVAKCERGESVQGPCPDKSLRVIEVAKENFLRAFLLASGPRKQRQRANNLKVELPLVAVGKRAEEHAPVRRDPLGVLVGELLEEIEGAQRNEPVSVVEERRDFGNASRSRAHQHVHAVRRGERAAVTAGKQRAKRGAHATSVAPSREGEGAFEGSVSTRLRPFNLAR